MKELDTIEYLTESAKRMKETEIEAVMECFTKNRKIDMKEPYYDGGRVTMGQWHEIMYCELNRRR